MRALALRASALFVVLVALPASAQPITIVPEAPVLGEPATLRFSEADSALAVDTVFVTYRPNSALAQRDTVLLGGFSSMKWTPAHAGVVQIALPGGASRNVSVRFTAPPLSGILILIAAGLILFGGAAFSMRKLFSGGPPRLGPEDLPDT